VYQYQLMFLSLDCEAEFESVAKQPNDNVVQVDGSRKADGLSH